MRPLPLLIAINQYKSDLLHIARLSVILSMHEAWSNCRSMNTVPQEPDYVASLVSNLTKHLGSGWSQILNNFGINFKVSGIYCHQTPKVQFDNMNKSSCELGDLIWCFFHRDKFGNTLRNAILFQAKCSSLQPLKINSDEKDQLDLYSKWPEFKYISSGKLNGQIRHVKPSAPRQGAQYLIIDDRPAEIPESGLLGLPNTYPIGCCIAQNPLIDHTDLGLELLNFISLTTGSAFDKWDIAENETDWSRTIWDLIHSSTEKAFRRARSGLKGEPRISEYPLKFLDGSFFSTPGRSALIDSVLGYERANIIQGNNDNRPPEFQERQWFDEGGTGVSVIFFESNETEG
jgi:hypothetical protein